MYCDEIRGIFPLLIFPDESIKNNDRIMRPINFHPIWFLNTEGETDSEHVDLIYNGKIYFAKKFQIFSEIKERKVYHKEAPFNMISVIMVLPKDMSFYRKPFLKIISETIIKDFKGHFPKIIESETLKEDLIRIPKNESIINKGDVLKENIKNFLKAVLEDYFSFIIQYYQKENLVSLES